MYINKDKNIHILYRENDEEIEKTKTIKIYMNINIY